MRDDRPVTTTSPTAPGSGARVLVERHRALAEDASRVLAEVDGTRARIAWLVESGREATVRAELAEIDVGRLSDLTDKNLRIGALRDGGCGTALDVFDADVDALDALPGVGPQTARSAVAAVVQLGEAIRGGFRVRIVLDRDDASGTELLGLLDRLDRLGPLVEPHRTALGDYASAAAAAVAAAQPATTRLTFAFRTGRTKRAAHAALAALAQWEPWLESTGLPGVVDGLLAACSAPGPGPIALWDDFERRAARYYALLGEIVPVATDVLAAAGMLPSELVDRIAAYPLDTSRLRAHLRGYQAFGARFALNQGRAMIGDEMGLGKTVQAIAAMAHLAAEAGPGGDRPRFLVVCPASVLINWLREVAVHSTLAVHRLHGTRREAGIADWLAEGGVGVTTFEGLRHVPLPADAEAVALLVVDEAHLVKNPRARRSETVAAWTDACWRVLLLTGTPMENRLEEFVALVRYLQPELVAQLPRHLGLAGADVFRAQVAPVYLRRNQADVLVELPELVAVQDWEEFSAPGARVYGQTVASGNFMAMRRAAFATPEPRDSTKLERLLEIVAESGQNGHKVLVFSYFRDVLDVVGRELGCQAGAAGLVFGPIHGSVPAERRQEVVDEFTAAPPGAVLVAQIQAGGVGINVQAASVVVLCEPQLKPTAEAQAIARVHRMGQVRSVQVHRLLVEESVDERIVELLAAKQLLFDEYVRDSVLAEGAVQAVDVTEAQLAAQVVAAEQARLGYGPVWDELEQDASGHPQP